MAAQGLIVRVALVVAGSLAALHTPGADLPKTGGFAGAATIEMKRALVSEVVASVAKQSGLKLSTGPNLDDRVVTMFAKQRAVWELLERMASTLDAAWTKRDDGRYVLAMPAKTLNEDARELQAERDREGRECREDLAAAAVLSRLPYARLEAQANALEAERDALLAAVVASPPDQVDRGIARLERLSDQIRAIPRSTEEYAVARWLDRFDAGQQRRLFEGEVAIASDRESAGWPTFPFGLVDLQGGVTGPVRRTVLARYSPRLRRFEAMLFEQGEGSFGCRTLMYVSGGATQETSSDERDERWGRTLPHSGDSLPVIRKGSEGTLGSLDDLAEALAKHSSLPCVVESQRRLSLFEKPTPGPLDRWLEEGLIRARAHVRLEEGWFMARPRDWRTWRASAPSERLLRRLEALAAPSLADFASFAGACSPEQAGLFVSREFVASSAAKRCVDALPALRVWNLMDAPSRAAALRGEPVLLGSMPPAAQAEYRQALIGSVFDDSRGETGLGQELRGPTRHLGLLALFEPGSGNRLALFLDRLETSAATVRQGNVTITGEPDQLPPGARPTPERRTLELRFMLGLDAQRCALFPLSLPIAPQTESDTSG